jgi:hypothetical protein
MENNFSKNHTQIAKGVAICMMLYHHLFVIPERISCDYTSLLNMVFPDTQHILAVFCKLCVCAYVFLSGYGLFFSLKGKTILQMYKNVGIRIIKFMTLYLIVFFIFVPIGMVTGYFPWSMGNLIRGIMGWLTGTFNNTWWFINVYIMILLVTPFIVYIIENRSFINKLSAAAILIAVYAINRLVYKLGIPNYLYIHYLIHMENISVMLSLSVGCICARYGIYEKMMHPFSKLRNNKRKIIPMIVMGIVALMSVVFRWMTTKGATYMTFDFIFAPVFIFSITTLIVLAGAKKPFLILGKHSTVMWLTHAFLCYTYAQKLVFLPYYSELVFLWFILLTLAVSYLVNLILVPINNLLYTKEHRFSYKGYMSLFKP